MPDNKQDLGTIIKKARHKKGYTQEQLSQITGLAVRTIGNIECGKQHPRYVNLNALITALDISGYLFSDVDENTINPDVQQFVYELLTASPAVQDIIISAGRAIIKSTKEITAACPDSTF